MRTALISDIHGNFEGLQVALEDLVSRQVDRIICLGDLVDGGEENDAVVEYVRANKIVTVRGNHDEIPSCSVQKEHQNWLNGLPEIRVENDVIFTHISPRPNRNKVSDRLEAWNVFDEVSFRLCFIGHNHFPVLFGEQSEDFGEAFSYCVDSEQHYLEPSDRYIICFGAIGYPRGGGQFIRYGIFDEDNNTIEFVKLEGPLLPYGLCF